MKKPMMISILCAALAVALFLWGFGQSPGAIRESGDSYALVIENDTGTFVMQLLKGMRQAAEENGASLTVYTPGEAEKAEGLSGAAIWLDDPADTLEALKDLPLVVVGQRRAGTACVLGDDGSAGEQLMNRALALQPAKNVALVMDDEDGHAVLCTDAARAAGGLRVARLVYSENLTLPEGCKAAVATSSRATRALADMKRTGQFAGDVLGVDTGESRIGDLESGLVTAMALDSPYAMGYRALGMLRELKGGGQPQEALTRVLLATRDNMYLAENVKQVFPLLQ